MRLVVELLPLLLLAVPVAYLVWTARSRRARRRGRWQVTTRALREGGHAIELTCPGEPTQLVRQVPADLPSEQLGDEMAEGLAEAEARAATLNSVRAMTRRSR